MEIPLLKKGLPGKAVVERFRHQLRSRVQKGKVYQAISVSFLGTHTALCARPLASCLQHTVHTAAAAAAVCL